MTHSAIQAVIFDMDGLLVDSEPMWDEARVTAFGADRLRWTPEDQMRVMGSSTINWARVLEERLGYEFTTDQIIERVVDRMEEGYLQHVPLMPGARAAIERMARAFPLGLASGSPHRLIKAVLESEGWIGHFARVVSSDEVSAGKPAPDTYLEIAHRLGLDPRTMAVVEDSANGILAGVAAGCKVITVPSTMMRPADDVLRRASLVLDSLHGLTPDAVRAL